MDKLISRQEALKRILEKWSFTPGTEVLPLAEALGRVPAGEYEAKESIPLVRASAMDGVAVAAARFAAGTPDTAVWKKGEDYVRADTGDDFDDLFDSVIRIEDVTMLPQGGFRLREGVAVTPGMNVRGSGSSLRKGAKLIEPGLPLRPTDLAALAMGGWDQVTVLRRPRIAFLPTGSELIPIGAPMQRGKNYDTNSLMVRLTLEEMGAECVPFPIVPDIPAALRNALHQALEEADVVILNGGSSKGGEDFNARLLDSEGELLFYGVSAVPGRPMGAAILRGKPVINLAGPALAAFYGLEWCIRPLVCRWLGLPLPKRVKVKAKLTAPFSGAAPMDMLCRMEVRRGKDGYSATPLQRGGADLPAMLRTNALYVSLVGDRNYAAGDEIEVELLRNIAELPEEE